MERWMKGSDMSSDDAHALINGVMTLQLWHVKGISPELVSTDARISLPILNLFDHLCGWLPVSIPWPAKDRTWRRLLE
jgi:hypothetical protein